MKAYRPQTISASPNGIWGCGEDPSSSGESAAEPARFWKAWVCILSFALVAVCRAGLKATSKPSECLISVAIGDRYLEVANLTGKSKQTYADKWNYRYVPYLFDGEDQFMLWCHSTELIKIFGATPVKFAHPAMKYFPLAHALNENRCDRVLMMDADAIVLNMDLRYDFDLPDAVKGNGEPHMMFELAGFAQGQNASGRPGSIVVPTGNTWCDTGCSNFTKFWSCLNTGILYFDNSAETMRFIERLMQIDMAGPDSQNCSTDLFNPWQVNQCHQIGDQCLSGCALYNRSRELGRDVHEMPDGIVCVKPSHQPPIQGLMAASWIHKGEILPEKRIPNGTFVVNIIHERDKADVARVIMNESYTSDTLQSKTNRHGESSWRSSSSSSYAIWLPRRGHSSGVSGR